MNETVSPHSTRVARAGGPVIELVNVSVGAGGRPDSASLEGINWRISAGDYWVIGGVPGSGKSDLLATLAGLYRPLGGTLKLFGRDVAGLSEDEFRRLFRNSPVKRIKHNRFVRNVCVALGNVGTKEDLPILCALAGHPDPLISEHAQWASDEIESREPALTR